MSKIIFVFLLFSYSLFASEVVYTIPPPDFSSKMIVSGCFCTQEGKFLILLRNEQRSCGNTWCLPARKIAKKESPITAAVRELEHSVGVRCSQDDLTLFRKFYVRLPDKDFELYLFEMRWPKGNEVQLEEQEHKAFAWVSLEEALNKPLIPGAEVYFRLLLEKKARR
ncbi:MAG: NUDIX hydrolase [Chlamydiae bacterium]|nr:NUDIX hydrolase [Chlamydiota bacterium]